MYTKQNFYSGQPLKASQLDAMEDGIIAAHKQAEEVLKGAGNIEVGDGLKSTQQLQDQETNVTAGYFNFTNKNPNATNVDSSLTGEIKYGAVGDCSSVFGGKAAAIGKRSMAQGTTTIAKGKYSHTEGDNCVALGDDSHAEGYKTTSTGKYSHAEGYNTTAGSLLDVNAIASYATHAEGEGTVASGQAAHAEGINTRALGNYSHTEGRNTVTEGENSHAEGKNTSAQGGQSHAEGQDTIASGDYSHAEGYDTRAIGAGSHASGRSTVAGAAYQTVIGYFNDNRSDTILEIGCGADEHSRTNALEVVNNGEIYIRYTPNAATQTRLYNLQDILRIINNALNMQNGTSDQDYFLNALASNKK